MRCTQGRSTQYVHITVIFSVLCAVLGAGVLSRFIRAQATKAQGPIDPLRIIIIIIIMIMIIIRAQTTVAFGPIRHNFAFDLTNQLVIKLTNSHRPLTQYAYWVPICL